MRLEEREHNGRTYLFASGHMGASVVFTTRVGGVSGGPYDSLNLGLFTGDQRDSVVKNRRAVSEDLSIPAEWAQARQVHGSRAVELDSSLSGRRRPRADAVVTRRQELPLAVMAADCVPVALIGEDSISAVHAGWRGVCAGVIESAAKLLSPLTAVIGPSIGPCHYEVGPEIPEFFRQTNPSAPDFASKVRDRLHFDLWGALRWQLMTQGVSVSDFDPPCTMCDSRFYSHRRDGVTGRQALIVWRGTPR